MTLPGSVQFVPVQFPIKPIESHFATFLTKHTGKPKFFQKHICTHNKQHIQGLVLQTHGTWVYSDKNTQSPSEVHEMFSHQNLQLKSNPILPTHIKH